MAGVVNFFLAEGAEVSREGAVDPSARTGYSSMDSSEVTWSRTTQERRYESDAQLETTVDGHVF